jgi:hypothetical protein
MVAVERALLMAGVGSGAASMSFRSSAVKKS